MKVSNLKRIEHLFAFTQQLDQTPVELYSKYQSFRLGEKALDEAFFSELRENGEGFAGLGEVICEALLVETGQQIVVRGSKNRLLKNSGGGRNFDC